MTKQTVNYTGIRTTFTLHEADGVHIPFQNGIPVPSFDPQDRLRFDLGGTWRKMRFEADHDFSLAERDRQWLELAKVAAGGRTESGYDDSGWETITLPFPENRIRGREEAN